jgi:flagellar hook-associated protein 3 FlgL
MNRVATFGNYQSALLNLMNTQMKANDAQERVSTQKNATDLVGFGRQSETLTALKGSSARLQGFLDTSNSVAARLTSQDLAMNRVGEGTEGIRSALGNAIAADTSVGLMTELEGLFQSVRGGLNTKHQGNYLFAGSSVDEEPLAAETMSDLTTGPLAAQFRNDSLKTASRVAEGTTLETGVLASDLGTDTLAILRDIQAFHEGPQGPLSGKLTEPQKTFLTSQLNLLEQAGKAVTEKTAMTGAQANQVDTLIASHKDQIASLDGLVADRTDADMLKAVTDLQLSQVAIQASAQVISQLRQSTLLNYLS